MIAEDVRAAEEELVRRGTGVGGASQVSADATGGQRAGSAAHAALDAWEKRSSSFPYAETTAHYQAVGRAQADRALVRRLASIPAARQDAFLSAWLPMTCDQEAGGYATYAGLSPHLLVAGAGREQEKDPWRGGPDDLSARLDEVTVAVVAELVRTEAAAAGFTAPAPRVRARLRATTQLLTRAGELAPARRPDPAVTAELGAVLAKTRDPLAPLSDAAERTAKAVQQQVFPEVARAAARSVLPVTRLHDEIMFIRSIQVFEALYEQIGLAVAEARDAVLDGRADRGADTLTAVTDRMTVLPALFRLLGTMPVEAFAVIRGFTSGRSAVQSLSYRRIEDACAPRPPSTAPGVAEPVWAGPTMQEAYLGARGRPGADRLAAQLRRLDASWRGMKRSHWGITLRIIGDVPGTGGTSGASYLKTVSEKPLFPALAGKESRADR